MRVVVEEAVFLSESRWSAGGYHTKDTEVTKVPRPIFARRSLIAPAPNKLRDLRVSHFPQSQQEEGEHHVKHQADFDWPV
jgi:hypothetical protein